MFKSLLAVAAGLAITLVSGITVQARTLTGCLSGNGQLSNLQEGSSPSKPCRSNQTQVSVQTADDTRLVFVTSGRYVGDFSDNGFGCGDGVAGADCICSTLADAEGLGTNFKAWLSTSNANEHPASSFYQHTIGPYVRVDGVKVAANWHDLIDGFLLHQIAVNEKGEYFVSATLEDRGVWTGTGPDGTLLNEDATCNNWTSGSTGEIAIVFDPLTSVNTENDTITLNIHGLATGDEVVYSNGGGTNIGGLENGVIYFVIELDDNTIRLASSEENAFSNAEINLSDTGTGLSHKLTIDPGGVGDTGNFTNLDEGQWTYAGGAPCDQTRRLYCFEQQ